MLPSTPRSASLPSRPVTLIAASAMLVMLALSAAPLHAQSREGAKRTPAKAVSEKSAPSILGTWSGTATVPLKDSSIVVPVVYTFTQAGTAIGGTAMVPGQGAGPISNVVRTGAQLTFHVTAPEGKVLEHDGALTADGAIEGMVKLDNLPVAKFRITQKKGDATTR